VGIGQTHQEKIKKIKIKIKEERKEIRGILK